MTSKAERKRKKRISLPGGETAPQRQHPRDRSRTNQPEDPRMTALQARQRHSGIPDATDALQPLCGTDLGLCIRALTTGDERTDLTNTWAAISAAHRNYRLLYIGQTGNPQGAAIAMVPDIMQADQSLRVDLRTHDERVAAAKSTWEAWLARIKALPVPGMIGALRGALDGFMGEATLWKDHAPTVEGRMAVEALRRMGG